MPISFTDAVAILGTLPEWLWIVLTLFLMLIVLRSGVLSYKHSQLEGAAVGFATDELTRLTAQVALLTSHKAQLISWASKAVRHFGGCGGCNSLKQISNREDLEGEFNEMMKGMA